MPPVRWKSIITTTTTTTTTVTTALIILALFVDTNQTQEAISMTSDGWRPIVGTRKGPSRNGDILHYRNQNGESIRAELTPATSSTTQSSLSFQQNIRRAPILMPGPGSKVPLHSKPHQTHPPLPSQKSWGHGHIPLTHVRKPNYSQVTMTGGGGKRHHHGGKPMRVHVSNHGNRDEVFVGAQSSNAYTFYKPTNNVKTRETMELGHPYNTHHHNIDFSNRFALPPSSENVYSQFNSPFQSFMYPKHPQSNDINYPFQYQHDDYIRNLVPPPLLYKESLKPLINKNTDGGTAEQIQKQRFPDNTVVQLPLPPSQFGFPDPPLRSPGDVQVTKEKLNVYHNNIPASYPGDYLNYDFHSLKNNPGADSPIKLQTYDVTEISKPWRDATTVSQTQRPRQPVVKQPMAVELNVPQFLPTPYRPEGQGVIPTLPSQAEVSTIFTKLSKTQRDRFLSSSTASSIFDVKEVSTHYPILGKPSFDRSPEDSGEDVTNEIVTDKTVIEEIPTTREPQQRQRPYRRRRPTGNRLRTTPATTTTTEAASAAIMDNESYESQRTNHENNIAVEENDTPQVTTRQRVRPNRYRTTTPVSEENDKVTRGRNRYRTRLPPVVDQTVKKRIRPVKVEIVTVPDEYQVMSTTEPSMSEETEEIPTRDSDEPEEYMKTSTLLQGQYEVVPVVEVGTTSEKSITTTDFHLSENDNEEDEITTVTVPTTVTTMSTSKPHHRIRGRPIKYDNSNRPRFSVKDYRQKLNQYTSSTSTTESYRTTASPSDNLKLRFPNRGRRPYTTTASTTASTRLLSRSDEVIDDESMRSRFVPKDPRHGSTTTETIITDKNVKAVNTRLRPFGRYRSTTTSPTIAPKVSIKPNLFTRRRPPSSISLKMRIQNRYSKKNETDMGTTTEQTPMENGTESGGELENTMKSNVASDNTRDESEDDEVETTTIDDILRNDQFDYSQRVSELTSSDKNDYNTFKSVSPTSRRIPNHFTIATDDPILPIEAFFTNFKGNDRN